MAISTTGSPTSAQFSPRMPRISASGYPALHHILCEPRQVLWFDLIDWSGVVYGIPGIGAVVLIVVDVIERKTDMLRTDEFRNVVYVPQ